MVGPSKRTRLFNSLSCNSKVTNGASCIEIQVNSTRERVTILESSVRVATRSYQLSLAEFESGNLESQDLSLAAVRFADAEESYLDAFIDYRNALVRLMRATYWDYEQGCEVACGR